jgi:hypothetical protein
MFYPKSDIRYTFNPKDGRYSSLFGRILLYFHGLNRQFRLPTPRFYIKIYDVVTYNSLSVKIYFPKYSFMNLQPKKLLIALLLLRNALALDFSFML